MKNIRVQITPWERSYTLQTEYQDLILGDIVILKINDEIDAGIIVEFIDSDTVVSSVVANKEATIENENIGNGITKIEFIRKANIDDLEKRAGSDDLKKAYKGCKQLIKQHDLPMKLVDVHFNYDRTKATFAFIADGRVDFRNLVKELTRHFNMTIRLQQIGIRDEAKISGDVGHCGRELCCKGHLKELASITSEMADVQQCVHRGSDRISGICGRLMCCLAYEEKGYIELQKKMPPIGAKVNVDGKRGVVMGQNILKQSVNVEFKGGKGEGRTVVEVDLNRHKK